MFCFCVPFITHPGGGISSYVGQQGAAGQSLEACLDQAVKDIPKERHHLTPVYLGATAGMRLLQWVCLCLFRVVSVWLCFSFHSFTFNPVQTCTLPLNIHKTNFIVYYSAKQCLFIIHYWLFISLPAFKLHIGAYVVGHIFWHCAYWFKLFS